jgi:ribose transport system permease protein
MDATIVQKTVAANTQPTIWQRFANLNMRKLGPTAALLALLIVFGIFEPRILSLANLEVIFEAAAVPAILVAGATFIIVLGSIDLSVEGIMGLACVAVSMLVLNNVTSNDYGVFGIIVAILIGAAFGLMNGCLNVYLRLPSLMATIGTWFVGLGCAYILFPATQPAIRYQPLSDLVTTRIFGLSLLVYLAGLVILLAHLVFRYTVLGRMIYAIGGDENIAISAGIPVKRYRILAFIIAGALSALAGICVAARIGSGYPNAGREMLFSTIGAAVIGGTLLSGGKGGPIHSLVGVFILVVLANAMLQLGFGPYTRQIIVGATIVIALAVSNWQLRSKLRTIK